MCFQKRRWVTLVENVSLLSSVEQLLWWLRPAICMMKLMFSRSSVAQSACCLLKALKAKLLIVRAFCAVLAALFPSLYYVLSFSSACPRTLSHCSLGKWGGVTMNHSWGYEMACVCARSHTSVNSWVTVWFSRVGCETWGVGREKEEQQQHDTDSTRQRPFTLSLFLSSCPWGDAAAALDIERHY